MRIDPKEYASKRILTSAAIIRAALNRERMKLREYTRIARRYRP